MPLIVESPDEYARVEYIAAKNGHTRTPGVALGESVPAMVNAGRWLVQCPVCASARVVHPMRDFWCAGCGNQATAGQPVPIVWPADMSVIEVLLEVRPVTNRNWHPGEDLDRLAEENEAHDLPGRALLAGRV